MFVEKRGVKEPIGGLLAYHCSHRLHMFFVLARDVEEAESIYSETDAPILGRLA
jgi:hypothetical protein